MAREYQVAFAIGAKLQSQFGSAFKNAQTSVVSLQSKIETLNRKQGDISAYQRQQQGVEMTRAKLETLQKQYANLKTEMEANGEASASLKNAMLQKQQQIERTTAALEGQEKKLAGMSGKLSEAGVDTGNLAEESKKLSAELNSVKAEQEAAAAASQHMGQSMGEAASSMEQMLAAAGLTVALKAAYDLMEQCADASISFETGMAGVQRTVGGSQQFLSDMGESFKEMSTEIPITTESLSGIATTAGQLGVAQKDVESFTAVMAQLDTTTDLTADSAATMLAQFSNITGVTQYDRLGAVVADLGDATATTASKVVEMSQGMAAAAHLAGMGATDIMGISAAVGSLGVEAQAGSTAMSTLINTLYKAVETGDGLNDFASVANMTAEQFRKAWGENAAGALNSFIQGLNDTERNGKSAIVILDELGIKNVRQTKAILGLASAGNLLSNTITQANTAWKQNTALTEKASVMYGTTQAKLTMAQNAANNLKIAVGDALTPTIGAGAAAFTAFVQPIAQFIQKNPALIKGLAASAGVIGTVTLAITGYAAAAKIAAAASALFFSSIPGLNLILWATAGIAGLTAGVVMLTEAFKSSQESIEDLDSEFDDLNADFRRQSRIRELCAEYKQLQSELYETAGAAISLDGVNVTAITLRAILEKEGFTDEDDLKLVESFYQDIQSKAGVMIQVLRLNGAKEISADDLETITKLGARIKTDSGELKQFLSLKGAEEVTDANLNAISNLGKAVKDGTYELLQTLGFENPQDIDTDDVALIVSMAGAVATDNGSLTQLLSLTGADTVSDEAIQKAQKLSENIFNNAGELTQILGFTDEDNVTFADILRISAMAAAIADEEGELKQTLSLIGADNIQDGDIEKIADLGAAVQSGYGMIWQTLGITGADGIDTADILKINALHASIADKEGELKQALEISGAENVTDETIGDIVSLKQNVSTGYGSLQQALAIKLGLDVSAENIALIDDLANSIITSKGELSETLAVYGFDSYADLEKACALSDAVKAANFAASMSLHLGVTGENADTLLDAMKADTVSLEITAGVAEGFTLLTADDFVGDTVITLQGKEDAENLLEATKLLKDGSAWIELDAKRGQTLVDALDLLADDPIISLSGSASGKVSSEQFLDGTNQIPLSAIPETISSTKFFTDLENGSVKVKLTPDVAKVLTQANLLESSTVTLTPEAQKTLSASQFMLGKTVALYGSAVGKLYADAFLDGSEYIEIKGSPQGAITTADYIAEDAREVTISAVPGESAITVDSYYSGTKEVAIEGKPNGKVTVSDYIAENERSIALTASVTNLAEVQQAISSLQTEADSLKDKAALAKTDLTEAKTQLADMEQRQSELEARLTHAGTPAAKSEIQTAIEAQTDAVEAQRAKVAELEGAYTSAATQYTLTQAAADELAAKEKRLTEIKAELADETNGVVSAIEKETAAIAAQIEQADAMAVVDQAKTRAEVYKNITEQAKQYASVVKKSEEYAKAIAPTLETANNAQKYLAMSAAEVEKIYSDMLEDLDYSMADPEIKADPEFLELLNAAADIYGLWHAGDGTFENMGKSAREFFAEWADSADKNFSFAKDMRLDFAPANWEQSIASINKALVEYGEYTEEAQQITDAFIQNLVDGVSSGAVSLEEINARLTDTFASTEGGAEIVQQIMAQVQAELDGAAESSENMADGLAEIGLSAAEVNAAIQPILNQMAALGDAYQEAYDEAYKSMDGQFKLFEEAPKLTEESVDKMIASLKSQADYMSQYSYNLQEAGKMGLSEGLLAQLSDGSKESAAYLAAIVREGTTKIDELNTAFASVEEGKDTFADTVASMQTDFSAQMDQLTIELAQTVAEMDMSTDAAQAGADTVQAFADAASGKTDAVIAAFRSISKAAKLALSVDLNPEGYATGTESAERGFKMVGENGPEIVWFNGGEKVMNAQETAAYQREHAVSAEPVSALPVSGGGAGPHIEVKPVYNLSGGMDTDEIRGLLDEHTGAIRDMVIDTIEELEIDRERSAYVP